MGCIQLFYLQVHYVKTFFGGIWLTLGHVVLSPGISRYVWHASIKNQHTNSSDCVKYSSQFSIGIPQD